jgi:hypothetical protein
MSKTYRLLAVAANCPEGPLKRDEIAVPTGHCRPLHRCTLVATVVTPALVVKTRHLYPVRGAALGGGSGNLLIPSRRQGPGTGRSIRGELGTRTNHRSFRLIDFLPLEESRVIIPMNNHEREAS